MKTRVFLDGMNVILNGEIVETMPICNLCQMYRIMKEMFAKWGNDAILSVVTTDGYEYKRWVRREQKNTKKMQCVNLVKETNRWQQMKAKKKADAEKAKREAKNAKARARYAAKKKQAEAVKAAGEQVTAGVQNDGAAEA